MILTIILKGCSIPLLPKNILIIYDSFIIRMVRILGSFCVILCLWGYDFVYVGLSLKLLVSIYLFLLILLSIVRIMYGFYVICNMSIYNVSIYCYDIYICFIILFRIFFMFLLDLLSFSVIMGNLVEIFLNMYIIKKYFYILYKRIVNMFL